MSHIDVTFGNVSQEQADRMVKASHMGWGPYAAGNTEPWITEIVGSLLKATGIAVAFETGAFEGTTTRYLAESLEKMGGGTLLACEIDPERAAAVRKRLEVGYENVDWEVRCADALSVVRSLPDRSLGLAWVDDDHTMEHVSNEVAALWQKMAPKGLIVLHDVIGVCDLRKVVAAYGGTVLDFPRAGPAGGIGIIQPIR